MPEGAECTWALATRGASAAQMASVKTRREWAGCLIVICSLLIWKFVFGANCMRDGPGGRALLVPLTPSENADKKSRTFEGWYVGFWTDEFLPKEDKVG
jgi:hypothetical protein